MGEERKGLIASAVLGALLVLWLAFGAHATWKPEYASQPPEVRAWYERAELTPAAQKRLGFIGCCQVSDVVKARFALSTIDGEQQWFYQLADGKWRQVPSDIIHWHQQAPDNRPTLFALSHDIGGWPVGTLTCFYPPGGGS